jgi:hypothetical protein
LGTHIYQPFFKSGDLVIAKENVERFKNPIRKITKRNRGVSFKQIILELNLKFRGWFEYYIQRDKDCFDI